MNKIMGTLFRAGVQAHVWLYRTSKGKLFTMSGRTLLLTTTGRKSGKRRTTPLMFVDHDGARLVAASAGGGPNNPGWYHNAKANPEVEVQLGAEVTPMTARVVDEDPERAELYQRFVEMDERFGTYQEKAGRKIPVIALTPRA